MEGLKPCPFCGKEGVIYVKCDLLRGEKYIATCSDKHCIGRTYKQYHTPFKAIAIWNRRASDE